MSKDLRKRRKSASAITQLGTGKDDKKIYKMKLAKQQGFICPVCQRDFSKDESKSLHLDHDHKTGMIRQTLCGGCNRFEGKIAGMIKRFLSKVEIDLEDYIKNLVEYWDFHKKNPSNVLHPDFKTQFDKKEKQRQKAKKRRENAKKEGKS